MDNEIVVQLAKFNDKSTTNNSNWSNNINETITLNQGDEVLVSKAFIDTRDLTSANITIEKDIELELEYNFYWVNDSNPGSSQDGFGSSDGNKQSWIVPLDPLLYNDPNTDGIDPTGYYPDGFKYLNNDTPYAPPKYSVQITSQKTKNIEFNTQNCVPNGWLGTAPNVLPTSQQNVIFADGRPYLLCYSDNSPYTQTWKYTLKAGSYSPDSLASLLTLNMASVKKQTEKSISTTNSNDWFDDGQPFVCNTSSYPPIWCMTNCDYTDPDGDGPFVSIINSNPYIQIDKSRGSVKSDEWYNGSTGSVGYSGQPDNYLLSYLPTESPGKPPNKSLCFKNFISDNPIPNSTVNLPDIAVSSITADEMVVGLYYTIDTLGKTDWNFSGDKNNPIAVGDNFVCTQLGQLIPNPAISTNNMIIGLEYQIVDLGQTYSTGYDTDWVAFGASNPPTVGDVFTCINNTDLIQSTNPQDINLINTISFQFSAGYDLSVIGGPALPPTPAPTNTLITDITSANMWLEIVSTSVLFLNTPTPTNGIQYTEIISSSPNNEIPTNGTQFISLIPGNQLTGITFSDPTVLQNINIGMILNVSNVGLINWALLGATNPNPGISVNDQDIVAGPYIVTNIGQKYGVYNNIVNSLFDTDWGFMTDNANPSVTEGQLISVSAPSMSTPYDNSIIYNVSALAPDLNGDPQVQFSGQFILVIDMGTSTYLDWTPVIQAPPPTIIANNIIVQLGDSTNPGNLANTNATFQIINNAYLTVGMNIIVDTLGVIDWALYTSTPTVPVVAGQTITITNNTNPYPAGTSLPQMADQFEVVGTGVIQSTSIPTPFNFTVTTLPTTTYTDNTFVVDVVPNDVVNIITNYTFPLAPFIPTTAPLPQSNITGSSITFNVEPTGTVSYPTFTHGTCHESLNPDNPNFFIYPLTLMNNVNSVSYLFNEIDPDVQKIKSFFGGPEFTYGFPLVGSTEIELAYNDATNRFQWNYTHSPLQQGAAPGSTDVSTPGVTTYNEVVGMLNSFTPNPNILNNPTEPPYNSSTCKLTAQSGILFKKMEPASFWHDILGFSTDLLVSDDELGLTNDGTLKPITVDNKNRFTLERFNNVTTTGLLTSAMNFTTIDTFPNAQESYVAGLRANTNGFNNTVGPVQLGYFPVTNQWSGNENISDFYREFSKKYLITGLPKDGSFPTTPSINSIYYQALDETKYINSIKPPLLLEDKYGHYLVSINGYGDDKGGLLNEKTKILSKAIISNYYVNQNSFVSLTFPDSQVYTHVGEPISLNNFQIQIIDPETMKPIEGLGENSVVYIQINKQYSKEMLSQV